MPRVIPIFNFIDPSKSGGNYQRKSGASRSNRGMRKLRRPIGFLGGTFNPPHLGHLCAAQACLRRLKLERVLFIPAAVPPHKSGRDLAGPRDRLEMVKLAVGKKRRFGVSPIEMRRKGPSFTIDTVKILSRRFPSRGLFFIIGADTVPEIPTWHRHRDILKLVRFAVVRRPGHRLAPLGGHARSFVLVPARGLPYSSRELRVRLARGERNPPGLPPAVARYIARKGLYGSAGKRGSAPRSPA